MSRENYGSDREESNSGDDVGESEEQNEYLLFKEALMRRNLEYLQPCLDTANDL